MTRLSTLLDDPYMSGSCHIHAIASHQRHGGRFALLLDHADAWQAEDEDCEAIASVWHVWSIHDGPSGLVARDVTGDTPLSALRDRAIALFPEAVMPLLFGDMQLDDLVCLEELMGYVDQAEDGSGPLAGFAACEIAAATCEDSVQAAPGHRPAMVIEEDVEVEMAM